MRSLALVLLAALAVASILGCDSGRAKTTGAGEKRSIAAADRSAYFEIASASGVLRGGTVRASLGLSRHVDRTAIAAARRRLETIRPADPQLASLKARLIAASSAAVESHGDTRRTARASVSATDTINAGLRRYAARHPAVAGLIPD